MIGYVYGIQSGQFIKVGAADDLKKRLHTFRLHNPHPLKLVLQRAIKENYWVERRMHQLLAEYTTGREWFDCSPEQVRDAFKVALKELIDIRPTIVGTARGWRDRTPEELAAISLPK
jgi:hypothetical protein